jgi:hypothetical protein
MTISATTQGLRMGVATSTSRPTVPFDGQVISETDTDTLQVYKGSAWAPVSGLQFIKSQAIIAGATTFTMSSAFSATYENYLITAQNLVISAAGNNARITINGSTGSTYSNSLIYQDYSSATIQGAVVSASSVGIGFGDTTAASSQFALYVYSPFLAAATTFSGQQVNTARSTIFGGIDTNAASSTAFTITMSANTFTSGNIRIYGIATS